MLLLGAGESGKSTFLKQMRIIHGINFEPELVREYQHVIYQNLVKGMQVSAINFLSNHLIDQLNSVFDKGASRCS